MNQTSFWWRHWPHLATKPLQALAIFLPLRLGFHVAPWGAVLVALALPALYSAVRKEILWPGCFAHLDAWKDEVADTWAAATVLLPCVLPWPWNAVALIGGGVVLWPLGLHRWALP